MILEDVIAHVIEQQQEFLYVRDTGLDRTLTPSTRSLSSHALIISGIRRCGKSTLLMQLIKKLNVDNYLYLNFESPQLYNFSIHDFVRLDRIIAQKQTKHLFFDEIQLVEGWERYIRQKTDEGFHVVITGSNASLLSQELGTKLTGRHITQELFPFSYGEFLTFKHLQPSAETLSVYMETGGFPEYVKTNDEEQLYTLFDDILIRDIVSRFGIKDLKSLQRLASHLYSNIGNRITATKLKQPLSIGATSTILNWFSYLEMTYLIFLLPMYSHSTKAQLINPKKVYVIDTGLLNVVSTRLTKDTGRKLENLVYLHLRRSYTELYYFDDDKSECDFIAFQKGKVKSIVQVCHELTPETMDRELNGLKRAMLFFGQKTGTIVTHSQADRVRENGVDITIIPAYDYLRTNDVL